MTENHKWTRKWEFVLYDPLDETYYTPSGYWVRGPLSAERFSINQTVDMVWLAGYFESRILSWPDMIDRTSMFGEVQCS